MSRPGPDGIDEVVGIVDAMGEQVKESREVYNPCQTTVAFL
jgi:hypothetical protein